MPISILTSKIIFMKYLPPARSKLVPKMKMLRIYRNLAHLIFKYPDLKFDVKVIFIKYLPPIRPTLVPKLRVLRIYWNLVHSIFQICQSRFWWQKWFLLNLYNLLGPNCSPNWKYSEFIEIWYTWYSEYPDLDFDVKNYFLLTIDQLLGPNCSQNEKCSELIEIW